MLRAVLLVGFPPESDVYYFLTQAAQVVLSGGDPYTHIYTGIPSGLLTPAAEGVFAYLPASAIYSVPFYLAGDVRYGLIAGDLIVGASLYYYGGRWRSASAALFLLLPPVWLFSTVYPNVAVIAMAFLALFLLLESRGYGVPGAVFLGLAVATVQFSLLVVPCALYLYAKKKRWAETLTAVGVALIVVLPFVLASPSAFFSETVSFQFGRAVLPLLGSGPPLGFTVNPSLDSVALSVLGVGVPSYVRGAAELMLVALLLRASDLRALTRNCAILVAISTFVLPTDFFWAYLELPFMLALFWFSSPRGSGIVKEP